MTNIPDLFTPQPTLERRDKSFNDLQPSDIKKSKQRILYILLHHPLLRYDEIPDWYQKLFGEKIKEGTVTARLNEMNDEKEHLGYVSTENEKLNIEGKQMVTAYILTDKGKQFLRESYEVS